MHGFALNIDPNMAYFDGMIPCGIFEHGVTSIRENIGNDIEIEKLLIPLIKNFKMIFNREYEI